MKFFPTVISLISLALGIEYVLSIRRVSSQITKLSEEIHTQNKNNDIDN